MPIKPQPAGAVPPSDNKTRAIAAIVFSVFGLSLGDAVIKAISVSFPLWQLYVLRSLVALPVLILILRLWRPGVSLLPKSWRWVGVRSLLLGVMWVFYYAALPHLQLSVAAAAYYTIPLFITLFAGLFAGERIGFIGWFAVALGFAGVLVMLRPDASGFNAYAILPIVAAILYALAMILTRTKCRDENPLVLSAGLIVMLFLIGIVASLVLAFAGLDEAAVSQNRFLLGGWIALSSTEMLALGVLAAAILIGSIFAAIAYQSASASVVATFDYTYLAFAIMWGVVFFADLPDAVTLLGIAMITVAGIIAVRR